MSFAELIPTVRSLSRADKLRLIQWLAGDLVEAEDSPSNPPAGIHSDCGGNGDCEDDRVQEVVHAVGLRNAIGHREDLSLHTPVESGVSAPERKGISSNDTWQAYPYWSPDHEAEAAAILMKMLEAEKSAP
jgi:hypothetical protein